VWACEGADRTLATAQHLHGGLGVDIDYPLHRLYLRTRQLLVRLGGTERSLAALGDLIAAGVS
jgi:alkylation response protein AidB-like acyl-CoA dehydrogenase